MGDRFVTGVRTLLFVCECQHPRLFITNGHCITLCERASIAHMRMNGAMDIRCDVVELHQHEIEKEVRKDLLQSNSFSGQERPH